MKLITVLINGRTDHIVNFDSTAPVPNSYIVVNPDGGGRINLFSFYKDNKSRGEGTFIFQTNAARETAYLHGLKWEQKEIDSELKLIKAEITLNIKRKPQDVNLDNKTIDSDFWDKNKFLVHFNADPLWNYIIKVTFEFEEAIQKQTTKQEFIINVAPKDNIYDLVLDYGSEASQMLISRRRNPMQTDGNRAKIFSLFRASFNDDPNTKDADFVQYDDDGDKFYKSIFFAKKNLNPQDLINEPPTAPITRNGNVKVLTSFIQLEEIQENFLTLPNIKVASHGGVKIPTVEWENEVPIPIFQVGDHYYYRRIVNSFLFQALRAVSALDQRSPKFLGIYLLMPNTYTQQDITRNLGYALSDAMKMAEEAEEKEIRLIKGFEVSSVSESDASFIGYDSFCSTDQGKTIPQGRYLIMDAGKGTLDFSVLDYNPDKRTGHHKLFESVYRSGIIGAGNAITYSIFIAILTDIYRLLKRDPRNIENEISEFVIGKITNPNVDESQLGIMMNYLEKYKSLYNEGMLTQKVSGPELKVKKFADLDLFGLTTYICGIIEKQYLVDESYIEELIGRLCMAAATKLKDSYGSEGCAKINYVVFAGRGFKMKKFREKMVEVLKKVSPSIETLDDEMIGKNLCLYVSEQLSSGRYNGRLIGKPQFIFSPEETSSINNQILTRKINFGQNFVQKLEPVCAYIIPILHNLKLGVSKIRICISKILPGLMDDDNRLDGKMIEELNRGLVEGFSGHFNKLGDRVAFGGNAYRIPEGVTLGKDLDVFFDGYDFIIRQEGIIYNFGNLVNLDGANVFESAFPYGQPLEGERIPFPRENNTESRIPQ